MQKDLSKKIFNCAQSLQQKGIHGGRKSKRILRGSWQEIVNIFHLLWA